MALRWELLVIILAILLRVDARSNHGLWSVLDFGSSEPSISDEEPIFIWPMPAEVSHANTTIIVAPNLQLVAGGLGQNAFLVSNAFDRYKRLIFSHHSHRDFESIDREELGLFGGGYYLKRLVVSVASDDDTLQLETDESYHLYVPDNANGEEAYLEANSVYGVLRGFETFSQLCVFNFTSKMVEVSNTPWDIRDSPRFKYRGILIDTSRHYQPVEAIKQVIDSMAYAKFNVLHWHIVDEESFPLEIPSFPRLWKGAYTTSERYTLDDAAEIVGYAKARGIKVMAEIDVPGHAESWGFGYPELWPSFNCREPLDVSKNFTFEVIDGIISDLKKVFPFGLFHLGGDEVDTDCWSNTPHIAQWLNDNNMTAYDGYVDFVLRAQQIAVSHGWDPVNWEETFDNFAEDLDPKTVVHNWLGSGVCPKVVANGFRCIVSNQDVWYLDHLYVPWKSFYMNEPLDGITNSTQQALVLGGEVCMWGETVDASDLLQTMWPRAAAAAERLWSPLEYTASSLDDAKTRLESFRCLLNQRNIAAAPVTSQVARTAPLGPGSCYQQ